MPLALFESRAGLCRQNVPLKPAVSSSARCRRTTPPQAAQVQETVTTKLRQVRDLPVEEGLPIVGMAPDLLARKYSVEDLYEKHGGPFVINASFMGGRAVMFRAEDEIVEAQVKRSSDLNMSIPESFVRLISNGRKPGLTTLEASRKWRAALSKVLSISAINKLHVPMMAPLMVDTVRRAAAADKEVLWFQEARSITFSIASRAVVGDLITAQDMDTLVPLFRDMSAGAFSLNFGLYNGIPGTQYNKSAQAAEAIDAYMFPIIREALEDEENLKKQDTTLGRLVKALQEEGADIMQSDDLDEKAGFFVAEAYSLMFAGTDTTAHSLSRVPVFMAKHPEWLERLWEEQQALIAVHGEEITPEVISASVVAAAVAQEVIRWGNMNAVQQRVANCDTVVGDVQIPAGMSVFLSPETAINSSGPDQFDPTLWLQAPGTESSASESSGFPASESSRNGSELATTTPGTATGGCPFSAHSFKDSAAKDMTKFVFGVGPRNCIGQNLAMTELVSFLMVLAREVKEVKMSVEEMEIFTVPVFPHPTGQPLRFIPRN